MPITKDIVIQAASDIADKEGLNKVSLKVVAKKLKIRPPSLYNHITNLDNLLQEIAHKGMREMNCQMIQASIGNSGDKALKAVSLVYFDFIIAHPGVYETIQWVLWHGNSETTQIFNEYKSLLEKLILSCNFKMDTINEILDLLMAVLHGYSTLQLHKALINPQQARKGLSNAIDTVLIGIHQKYS